MTLKPLLALCAAITFGHSMSTNQFSSPYAELGDLRIASRARTPDEMLLYPMHERNLNTFACDALASQSIPRPKTPDSRSHSIFDLDPNTYVPLASSFQSLNPEMHEDEQALITPRNECRTPTAKESSSFPSLFDISSGRSHNRLRFPRTSLDLRDRSKLVMKMKIQAPIKPGCSSADIATTYKQEAEYFTQGMHDVRETENNHLTEIANCLIKLSMNPQKNPNTNPRRTPSTLQLYAIDEQIKTTKRQIINMKNHQCDNPEAELAKNQVITKLESVLKTQLSSEDYKTLKKLRQKEIALERFRQSCSNTDGRVFKQKLSEIDLRMLKVERTLGH